MELLYICVEKTTSYIYIYIYYYIYIYILLHIEYHLLMIDFSLGNKRGWWKPLLDLRSLIMEV